MLTIKQRPASMRRCSFLGVVVLLLDAGDDVEHGVEAVVGRQAVDDCPVRAVQYVSPPAASPASRRS
jgi:hypothetical protein